MKTIKQYIKANSSVLRFSSFVYNLVFSGIFWVKRKNVKKDISNSFCGIQNSVFRGKNLYFSVGYKSRLKNCKIINYGNNNTIIVGDNCHISNTTFWFEDDNNHIVVNNCTSIEGANFCALEGSKISIGYDCMLSHDIELRTSDSHGIWSLYGERINKAKDINVNDRVWIGARSVLLKGTNIPEGCIIGHSSLCSNKLVIPNAIYAGVPVRLIKENVKWSRER